MSAYTISVYMGTSDYMNILVIESLEFGVENRHVRLAATTTTVVVFGMNISPSRDNYVNAARA